MNECAPTLTQQLAQAAVAFHWKSTGHICQFATVALTDDTLVITLHGALSRAELSLARNPAGAVRVRKNHQQLFLTCCEPLLRQIQRITGVAVRQTAVEVETVTGTIIQVFTTGTLTQAFLLVDSVPGETWSGSTQKMVL
jgi:uncharacterized protein YbcI